MRVDAANAVTESNEANNIARLEGIVILPDQPNLTVTAFDFSPQDVSLDGGTAMTFSAVVGNTGSQPTTGGFWVEFREGFTDRIGHHLALLKFMAYENEFPV